MRVWELVIYTYIIHVIFNYISWATDSNDPKKEWIYIGLRKFHCLWDQAGNISEADGARGPQGKDRRKPGEAALTVTMQNCHYGREANPVLLARFSDLLRETGHTNFEMNLLI